MTTPSPPPTCEFQSDPMAVTQVSQPLGMVDTHCSPEQAKTNKRTKHKTRAEYKNKNTKQEQTITGQKTPSRTHRTRRATNMNHALTVQIPHSNDGGIARRKQTATQLLPFQDQATASGPGIDVY